MSIVERVAELLGSVPQAPQRPPAHRQQEVFRDSDVIDRAVNEFAEHSGIIEPSGLAGQPSATAYTAQTNAGHRPGIPDRKTSQALRINLDKLRQQGMITPGAKRSPIAESFRRIKRHILTNVANPRTSAPANLVMVTSALPGEGKTFCAVNLAISIALEIDTTVLLVDADVAKPCVPQILGLNAEQGLLDVLDHRVELADVLWHTDIGKLNLLPAGTAHDHATELLASDVMRALLREIAERYHDRIVIFDSPPLLVASEAAVLANQMGQVVMVVEAGKTPETALKTALSRIESDNVIGLLLNKGQGPEQRYHYGGYG